MLGEAQRVHGDMVDTDRTSELPGLVLDLILSYLPLRDIVRTSILSTNWRYNWATVPKLVFDENCLPALWNEIFIPVEKKKAVAGVIDHVLSLHRGSIEVLKIKDICINPDIDRWVLHVSRQPIKELELILDSAEQYRMHSSLYSCESLVTLKLSDCFLSPPSSFRGFKHLKCLHLRICSFEGDACANLISSCPLLEDLSLHGLDWLYDLEIDAPNLQRICIRGYFNQITFRCSMAELSNVVIELVYYSDGGVLLPNTKRGLKEFFINLPSVQRLEMRRSTLRQLAVDGLKPESMPFHLKVLHHLIIWIDLDDLNSKLVALCLLNSSPNLTDLEIKSWSVNEPDAPSILEDGTEHGCKFEKLRRVKVGCIDGGRSELELMKFVLGNSPVLEKMTITCRRGCGRLTLEKVLRFDRLSPDAEVVLGPLNDGSDARNI